MSKYSCYELRLKTIRLRVKHVLEMCKDVEGKDSEEEIVQTFVAKCEQLEAWVKDYQRNADSIAMLEEKPSSFSEEEFNSEIIRFDDTVAKIRAVLKRVSVVVKTDDRPMQSDNAIDTPFRLPKITIPPFSGNVSEWSTFFALFKSLVMDHRTLNRVEKFHYLRVSLQGEALDLIKGLELTAENFEVAICALQNRYENIRKIATAYADRIILFPTIQTASAKHLRALIAVYRESTEALKALEIVPRKLEGKMDGLFLFLIILRKLDQDTRCQFERSLESSRDIPTPDSLINFLEKECSALEALQDGVKTAYSRKQEFTRTVAGLAAESWQRCVACNREADHQLYKCKEYLKKSSQQRKNLVRAEQLCFNCLQNHTARECTSTYRCIHCNGKHHSSLHLGRLTGEDSQVGERSAEEETTDPSRMGSVVLTASLQQNTVVLSTIMVGVRDNSGRVIPVRALLDSGSQACYATSHLVQRLGLRPVRSSLRVVALSQQEVSVEGTIALHIGNREGSFEEDINAIVLKKITGMLPTYPLPENLRSKLKGLQLADPEFDVPRPVDLLLGADLFSRVLLNSQRDLGPGYPKAISSKFGWIVMGAFTPLQETQAQKVTVVCHTTCEDALDDTLQKFWEIEQFVGSVAPREDICEKLFCDTYERDPNGQYVVRLPFKPNAQRLGTSYGMAESRFLALERRLMRNPEQYSLYRDYMKEYIESGHMELFCPSGLSNQYYIPHHGVLKMSSSTTKLRVVFDASMKSSTGQSLNDVLLSGPALQNDIMEVLMRFRTYSIGFTADIKQMFRCIWIHPEDREHQLILWRESNLQELKSYRLNTVTFGVTCSPYLAMRSLIQLAKDEGEEYGNAAEVLCRDVFVDDVVTGAQSVEEALLLQAQLIELLKRGGFHLRKWASNNSGLLRSIPEAERETPRQFLSTEHQLIGILGMGWLPNSDKFVYSMKLEGEPATKREVLAYVAKIYDPMGYLCPVVFWAKSLLQHIWTLGLKWDDMLPEELIKNGEPLYRNCLSSHSSGKPVILLAKSRVAPLRQVTLPRLELCGAHLLAKLLKFCTDRLGQQVVLDGMHAWTDSTIVLSWIRTSPHLLKTFVANRVAEIQEWVKPSLWHHIDSQSNPADCASRGMYPAQLGQHEEWWQGPPFLALSYMEWPVQPHLPERGNEVSSEHKLNPLNILVSTEGDMSLPFLKKYSSWLKLVRVTAYVLRFLYNVRHRESPRNGVLTGQELRMATVAILYAVQLESFASDYAALKSGRVCTTRLQRLTPFIDGAGLLRVGGRLEGANLRYGAKHPVLLPKSHHISGLLIDYFHKIYLHAGPRLVQSLVSRQYWILSARSEIRKRIRQCVVCFRSRPVNRPPLMADLPASRVCPSRPFSSVHLDYAGPFMSKTHRRSQARCKLYLCLFICSSSKAIHLEAVSDLSTAAFLAAFQRFISRRGLCAHVYSDCGSNLIGGSREIDKLCRLIDSQRDPIMEFSAAQGIVWHFQPPSAPHFGGLHEAAVKAAKYHVKRVVGKQVLTYEEYATLFTRVEAILNSRPLCPLSDDPAEYDVLTPGHFLIGAPLTTLPETSPVKGSLQSRWRMLRDMATRFWERWKVEYLHTLIQRSKWFKGVDNIQKGQLVLLQEDRLPPQEWSTARVEEVCPGSDGTVRVVRLKTTAGSLTRPAVKVFPLPIC